MTYTSESHIKSVKDVETFFHHIVSERKVNFQSLYLQLVVCQFVSTKTVEK